MPNTYLKGLLVQVINIPGRRLFDWTCGKCRRNSQSSSSQPGQKPKNPQPPQNLSLGPVHPYQTTVFQKDTTRKSKVSQSLNPYDSQTLRYPKFHYITSNSHDLITETCETHIAGHDQIILQILPSFHHCKTSDYTHYYAYGSATLLCIYCCSLLFAISRPRKFNKNHSLYFFLYCFSLTIHFATVIMLFSLNSLSNDQLDLD